MQWSFMKTLVSLIILLSSLSAWSATCDLSLNDARLQGINRQFDEGELRGEDHLIQLTLARRDRAGLVEICLGKDENENLSKEDLEATKENIQSNLSAFIEEHRVQIEFEIAHDRIGMATQIMMERDKEKLRVANLMALIDSLIKNIV
jgi:hypothetical protein